jgi:hypothetical protein
MNTGKRFIMQKRNYIIFFITFLLNMPLIIYAQSSPKTFCGGLGNVYGAAFNISGNLMVIGSDGSENAVWEINDKGEKTKYITITDPIDALAAIGISLHSKYPGQIAVDTNGNLWITSLLHGGAFLINSKKEIIKVYLNSYEAISLLEKNPSQGTVFDNEKKTLYLITSGPLSSTSTTFKENIITLPFDAVNGSYKDLDFEKENIATVRNNGIKIDFHVKGLIKNEGTTLFCVGENAVYELKNDNSFKILGEKFEGCSLWGGTIDNNGNIYVSVNSAGFIPGSGKGNGRIVRIEKSGKQKEINKTIKEPIGIVYKNGQLYVTDRLSMSVLLIKL